MSDEEARKMSLGVTIVSLIFLFFGVLEVWAGLSQLGFDILFGSLLIGEGIISMFISLGISWLKRWAWYLAVGRSIMMFLRYFAIPHTLTRIPLELIVLPYLFVYLFIRRDLFLKKVAVGIKTWLKMNKFFILAMVVWVSIFVALKPFAMEGFTVNMNNGINHQIRESGPIRVVAWVLKQSDLDPNQDYYSVNIWVHSEKTINLIHLAVRSEQGICYMWLPSSGWKTPFQAYVDVTGEGTNQIQWAISKWAISTLSIFDFDFEAEYRVSEGDSFDWYIAADVQRLMSIWWIGLDAGALGFIIAWSAIRYKEKNKDIPKRNQAKS